LPAEQREVITLKVWGDLTFSEIGEALEIPANTAASRYRYGLAELRRLTKQVLA
jgi:RNA polymerase sigma-70 factor (ECF subfamily)